VRAVCFAGWKHEMNFIAILRLADAFGCDEFLVWGRRDYKRFHR